MINNSLKFKEPNKSAIIDISGKLVSFTTSAVEERLDGYEIKVADNGIGFDEKYLDRIFQPFQRLHTQTEYEGNGMGLAICRKIVERHGGDITAHSQPGQGASFCLSLPLDP